MDHTVNLFEEFRDGEFDRRLFDVNFVKEHLRIYPINIFELKDKRGCTIFHRQRYDKYFTEWCLQKWPTNIFELKNDEGGTIFHTYDYSTTDKDFIKRY
jgi:hypothetical protein